MHGTSVRWIGTVNTADKSGMRSGFFGCSGAAPKRIACVLAVAVLACAPSARGQIVEEDGFPVKGDSASEESFVLSCPAHLYVSVGASVVLSCTATGIPEEGVRYGWESLSGGGLHLLSTSDELSPLFTVPVSGEGAEYAYRLTAMAVGVYETVTVRVVVESVPGDIVQDRGKPPGLQEECDPFTIPDELGGGCLEGKAPVPFGFGPEEEGGFLFPEAPGLLSGPVRGGGPDHETPPRLDCPVAVFLEELETGQLECHAWDAAGEEYLEYSWEPVGSTTRDYLDNPRLMPENAPNPSVVAPEAPRYDTLESFLSGDRAFRYRYRLTATSRLTGLSSREEVEVFVSSSRPSVYCPLEVVVEEGETTQLDCEGADPLSSRMDYDEEAASILWEWEGLWGTSTAPLTAKDLSSPLFTAPPGSAGEEYHYIASMTSSASGVPRTARRRVTVTVIGAEEGTQAAADDSAPGVKALAPSITCNDPDPVYEGASGFTLDCTVTDAPQDSTYSWTGTDVENRLTGTDSLTPTFTAPGAVDADTDYEYTVTLSATGIDDVTEGVTVTVKNKPNITLTCEDSPYEVDEGDADIELECEASDGPDGSTYTWSWSPSDKLTGHDTEMPTFDVPDDVDQDTTWTYTVTASADNADDGTATVTVTVKDTDVPVPVITCVDAEAYEGAADFALDCSAENEPTGATYAWAARGSTTDTSLLTGTDGPTPTFDVPDDADADTDYEYTVTLSAAGIDDITADVTVTVLEKPDITLTCEDSPYEVDEGSSAIGLECEADGAPGTEPDYTWSWSPTTSLTGHDTATPTFAAPDSVDQDTTWTYTATATADNADDGTAEVTVTVKDTDVPVPVITCVDAEVYEGAADFALDCSVTDEPTGATYSWEERGSTTDTSLLTGTDGLTPTFSVPDDADADTDYEYTVTLSASGIDDITADVTVTVLEKPDITLTCEDSPYEVDEADADIELECEASGASGDEADYTWSWSPTTSLTGHDTATPVFEVPDVDQDTTYTYTVTASADNADDGTAEVTVTVKDTDVPVPVITCVDAEVYEGAADFALDCSVTDEPTGATYSWEERGSTSDTSLLTGTDGLTPTFDVPDDADADTDYEYTVTLSASGIDDITADVTVTVLEKPDITLTCEDSPYEVDEGSSAIELECEADGAPGDNPQYTWSWSPTTSLTGHDTVMPTFDVPDDVDQDTTWTYTVTATAENADDGTAEVTVKVKDTDVPVPVITCVDAEVYEGAANFALDCSAQNEPTGATYAWAARGSTTDTSLLTGTDGPTPTFDVPDDADADTDYEYTVTLSAAGIDDITADVTVTVLEKSDITLTCEDSPYEVDEADADIELECEADGAPGDNPQYTWSWSPTTSLTGHDTVMPTFDVPDDVDQDTTWTYTVTATADNADDGTAEVTVTVKDTDSAEPSLTCEDAEVDEGAAAFVLDCSVTNEPTGATYEWTGGSIILGLNLLSSTTILRPTFFVPVDVNADRNYLHRLTLSAPGIDDVTEDVTITVKNKDKPSVLINCGSRGITIVSFRVPEESSRTFSCSASGAPGEDPQYAYSWTARDPTPNTAQLSATDISSPVFTAPDISAPYKDFHYTVTATADNAEPSSLDLDIRVIRRGGEAPAITCNDSVVYEGSGGTIVDCTVVNEPDDAIYAWSTRNTNHLQTFTYLFAHLSGTRTPRPTFLVPDRVHADTKYEYTLTMFSQDLFDPDTTDNLLGSLRNDVTVTVLKKPSVAIDCGPPGLPVIAENTSYTFACSASGARDDDPRYTYSWTARGDTQDTSLLSRTDISSPVFTPPDISAPYMDFHYTITATADNVEPGSLDLSIRVTRRGGGPPAITCNSPDPVYERTDDIVLFCWTADEPPGATYAWTARGSTPGTDDLSSTTIVQPTFDVPDNVSADTDYEYTLTLSASGIDDVTKDVTITVKNRSSIVIDCGRGPGVTYFGGIFENNGAGDISCIISGIPGSDARYRYVITARHPTTNPRRIGLRSQIRRSDDVVAVFRFSGEQVHGSAPWKDYYYTLTVTADNVEEASLDIHIYVVNDNPDPRPRSPVVTCTDPDPVYEGSDDIALDCTAANEPSGATYAWTARGSTSDTALLSATTVLKPTFDVPDNVSADTDYEYRVTMSAPGIDDVTEDITVTVLNNSIRVTCEDNPYEVYEGGADLTLDCSASGAPAGSDYAYAWTSRGDTQDTALLSAVDVVSPTFLVPDEVAATTTYEYLLTVSADNAEDGSAEVTVTVLNTGALRAVCADPGSVHEGSVNITFDCEASGAPSGSTYEYVWTARGATANTALLIAGTDGPTPTFAVPDEVDWATTYEYLLTASAENAEDASARVTVTVLNRGALRIVCADPGSVYEGSDDVALDCRAAGAPAGSDYTYTWTARGDTPDVSLLSAADVVSPTFLVPDEVDETTTYEYLLTVSAENAESATAEVTVMVLNKGALSVVCTDPGSVYEGSSDIALDCTASGAPAGSEYAYVWEARGDTQDTALLSAADIASPVFFVPDEVAATTTYEYLLTASAENAESATAEVTVTVLNRGALAVVCADPGSVYESSADIALDCTASGAPSGSTYEYVWTARGATANTALLIAGTDGPTPTFAVPDEVDWATTYEYLLTASAENAEDASARVTVTVLNRGALRIVCADPGSVYEGSDDVALDCRAAGAPAGSDYTYTWTARGDTPDVSLLSAADVVSPTFLVPDEVDEDETYEYLLTVSAENAESATAEVTVTVLNKGALSVVCADPGSVYEGSDDVALDCRAAGAPAGSDYTYTWTARGDTPDVSLLSAADVVSPTFLVPDEVDETTTYEYLLTVSAENAESATAEVTVMVLNKGALSVVCADPGSVYEGSDDVALDCRAAGAPAGSDYTYTWTARGDTPDVSLLSAADVVSPTFLVPDEVDETTTYEYLLTVSAENAESATAEVTVMVLNKGALSVVCADPGSVYEGSDDVALDCRAAGAPAGSDYTYTWTARGDTPDVSLLSAADVVSPTFLVPDEVDETTTYEYLLTVSAENAESATAEVTVMVLNKGALSVVCADPGSVYEGSDDVALDCRAAGAPAGSDYTYVWEASGNTPDTSLLSAADIASPTFYVPGEVDEDETYEYLLTVSADNAEDATAEVAVTVLKRVLPPPPVSPPPVVSPPVAEEVTPGTPSTPSALGVTVSASPVRFGVQSSDTAVSLDPVTDQISTHISGPYHVGRMTLALGGSEALDENGEMDLSIEIASPVVLKRADAIEASLLVLSPNWSYAESCEQLSSQTIGGLYTEVTLSEPDCRLLRFGGELDLLGVASGRYAGSLDVILRSGESEETFAVEVSVTVVPAQRVITIGPGGVRFSTSRELPAGLTEEQNLSIYPDAAFLNEEKPNGVFELSNPSLIPLEVSVSARFGYTEATENGREVVVEDASGSRLGDLSQVVDIHPGVLVLMPGEKGLVRYGVQEGALAAMAQKGYAAFFDVVSEPRQYVRSDQMPEEVTGDRTARVTMRVPGVYVPGEGASQLRARLLSISFVGSLSATFLVETQDHPFVGEVVAYGGDGRELGRQETLVYTRSRVRVPLSRMPEEGAVFLRFSPRGSGRAPDPAPVRWDAPRRDIGAAEDKDRATTSQVLVQKP